jgi:SAM-dependent methyltransferase
MPLPNTANPAPWLADNYDISEFPIENDTDYQYTRYEIPLPSRPLRATVSDPELGQWLWIGSTWATVCNAYLPEIAPCSLLDIGCGVGKIARFLLLNPGIHYCGFDIFLPAIEWCRRMIVPITDGRFRFEHYDGISAMYNPRGKIPANEYHFPVADSSMDLAIAASVFTHLYEKDMLHYLKETYRSLRQGGRVIISFQFLESYPFFFPGEEVPTDKNLYGNEQMMFINKEYLFDMARSARLEMIDDLGKLCGQDTVVLQKKE